MQHSSVTQTVDSCYWPRLAERWQTSSDQCRRSTALYSLRTPSSSAAAAERSRHSHPPEGLYTDDQCKDVSITTHNRLVSFRFVLMQQTRSVPESMFCFFITVHLYTTRGKISADQIKALESKRLKHNAKKHTKGLRHTLYRHEIVIKREWGKLHQITNVDI